MDAGASWGNEAPLDFVERLPGSLWWWFRPWPPSRGSGPYSASPPIVVGSASESRGMDGTDRTEAALWDMMMDCRCHSRPTRTGQLECPAREGLVNAGVPFTAPPYFCPSNPVLGVRQWRRPKMLRRLLVPASVLRVT